MKSARYILALACLTVPFGVSAAGATYGDHAVVACKSANLLVSAFSVTYDSAANPGAGCAATLKALSNESMYLLATETTSDTVVYTYNYNNFSAAQ